MQWRQDFYFQGSVDNIITCDQVCYDYIVHTKDSASLWENTKLHILPPLLQWQWCHPALVVVDTLICTVISALQSHCMSGTAENALTFSTGSSTSSTRPLMRVIFFSKPFSLGANKQTEISNSCTCTMAVGLHHTLVSGDYHLKVFLFCLLVHCSTGPLTG